MQNKKSVFSVVIILFWFSLYIYVPQLTNYAKELGASYKLIGLIGGAYGLSQTILRIPIGILSDKIRKRKIFVIAGITFAIISSSIVYLFPGPNTLLIARFMAGIASATWVSFTVLFLSYYDSNESSKAIGIVNANSKAGQLLAMLAGGIISLKFGVRTMFLVSMVIGLISMILSLLIQDDNLMMDKSESETSGIFTVVKDKNILHISFLAALVQLITYSTTFGFTPIIASNLGANNFELGMLSALFNLPQVLFSILAGTIISKKIGEKNTLLIGFILITATCFIIPIIPNLKILFIVQLISGIGNAITFALLMTLVMKGVNKDLMTTTMGFYQAVFGMGMVAGPIILGAIGDLFSLNTGFFVIGLLGVIGIFSAFRVNEAEPSNPL